MKKVTAMMEYMALPRQTSTKAFIILGIDMLSATRICRSDCGHTVTAQRIELSELAELLLRPVACRIQQRARSGAALTASELDA